MNKSARINGVKVPIIRSTKIEKSDKCTSTPKELGQCRKCQEREHFERLNNCNESELRSNYTKALSYINSCHHVINEFTKQIAQENSANTSINMPDLPNFLALYTSLLYTQNANSDSDSKQFDAETNTNNLTQNKEQNFNSVDTSKYADDSVERYIDEFENKEAGDCVEEIYAREITNFPKEKLTTFVNSEPITSVMDEVCNLADIASQKSVKIKASGRARKNSNRKTDENANLKDNERWKARENEDTDSDDAKKRYTMFNVSAANTNCDPSPSDGAYYSKQSALKTKIPQLNKSSHDEDNFPQFQIRMKSANHKPSSGRPRKSDFAQQEAFSGASSNNHHNFNVPSERVQRRDAPSKNNPNLNPNLNLNQNLNQNQNKVPFVISQRVKNVANFCASSRTDLMVALDENGKPDSYYNNEGSLINISKTVHSQHFLSGNENYSQSASLAQNIVNMTMKRQHLSSSKKADVYKSGGANTPTNKNSSHVIQEQSNPSNFSKRQGNPLGAPLPAYKVEHKPNDFFTDHHRSPVKVNSVNVINAKKAFCNKAELEQAYSDSDIDDDNFGDL